MFRLRRFWHGFVLAGAVSIGATSASAQYVEVPFNTYARNAYFNDFLAFRSTIFIYAKEFFTGKPFYAKGSNYAQRGIKVEQATALLFDFWQGGEGALPAAQFQKALHLDLERISQKDGGVVKASNSLVSNDFKPPFWTTASTSNSPHYASLPTEELWKRFEHIRETIKAFDAWLGENDTIRQLSLNGYYGEGSEDPRQKMNKDAFTYLALLHAKDAYPDYCQLMISSIAAYTSKTVPEQFSGRKCTVIGYELAVKGSSGTAGLAKGGNLWAARFEGEVNWYVLGIENGTAITN